MLNWLSKLITAKPRAGTDGRAVRFLRARYDAAVTNDENRRHWANADGLSANAANSPEVRRLLRNRARYEVANNSYARGHRADAGQRRHRHRPAAADAHRRRRGQSADRAGVHRVGRRRSAWPKSSARCGWRGPPTAKRSRFSPATRSCRPPIQLDLRLIEADQVATPDLNSLASQCRRRHRLRRVRQPGRVPRAASSIRAIALRDPARLRPGAGRRRSFTGSAPTGPARPAAFPDIMPALPLFAQLRRFTLAVLAAAETAADFAGILYTDAPANGEADAAEPFEPIELEKRALVTMPGGWKMSQMEAEQPATTYAEFKHEILNEIARCLNMPFNVAAGNSSGYNYASGRLDHQTYFKSIRVEQAHLECVVLDRILAAWFDEAALLPDFLPAGLGPIAEWPHQWFWDGHEHVDPAKEANAQATRLANHTTTLADEYARRGRDWETQLRQRAKELALMNELGLLSAAAAPQPTDTENENDAVDEETASYAA